MLAHMSTSSPPAAASAGTAKKKMHNSPPKRTTACHKPEEGGKREEEEKRKMGAERQSRTEDTVQVCLLERRWIKTMTGAGRALTRSKEKWDSNETPLCIRR